MSEQWHYIRGNKQLGPVSAADLKQLASGGQLSPTDMVWNEGTPNWVPAANIQGLFASGAVGTAPPVPAGSPLHPSAANPVSPPPPSPASPPGRFWTREKIIGFSVGGGVLLVLIILLAVLLSGSGRETSGGDPKTAGGDDWGRPIRVKHGGTTFLVGLKDAWWTDHRASEDGKKTFFVVYYSKNLGPREGMFSPGKVEIKTDKGHIFPGRPFHEDLEIKRVNPHERSRDVDGWWPKQTNAIEETGESGIVFWIPSDQVPVQLISDLGGKLPQRRFGFRKYTEAFGFLPEQAEKAVPGLIKALKANRGDDFLGKFPDDQTRTAAAEALGWIGPPAKAAIPALNNLIEEEDERFRGRLVAGFTARDAAQKALANITAGK